MSAAENLALGLANDPRTKSPVEASEAYLQLSAMYSHRGDGIPTQHVHGVEVADHAQTLWLALLAAIRAPVVRPMSDAPRDGTRVLLHYVVMHYGRPTKEQVAHLKGPRRAMAMHFQDWYPDGDVWEECFFESKESDTNWGMGRDAWTSWCGNPRTRSTNTISEERCLGWMPVPAS